MRPTVPNAALATRYSNEVDDLIRRGWALVNSLLCIYEPKFVASMSSEERKKLPQFHSAYQTWYSEALTCMEILLPNRIADFRAHYEIPKNRKRLDASTYRIADALQGVQVKGDVMGVGGVTERAAIPHMQQQAAMISALQARLSKALFDIRSLLQADLFDNELDVASELLKKGFCRAAGAVAGVVLEGHLKQICQNHAISLPNRITISAANDKLKASDLLDQAQWRFNQHLGDIRNLCDHKTVEPTRDQISDLIAGVTKVIKTVA